MKMLSFHNDIEIKNKYIERIKLHQLADEIEKGYYWENGKGCAVGCTIHGSDHSKYEIELGIPKILALLEDKIFESLPNDRAKVWPLEFLESINVGVDLSEVWPKFAVWLLTDETYGVLKYAIKKQLKDAIQAVANGYLNYKSTTQEEWVYIISIINNAYSDPSNSAYQDDVAVSDASYASYAASYAASDAAASAAAYYAASYTAYYAADAASDAASAAHAHAAHAVTNFYNAKIIHIKAQADKLLELLRL